MKVVIQKVSEASVVIDGVLNGEIAEGLMILVGVSPDDNKSDVDWLSGKISRLRIFNDPQGIPNLSVKDVQGDILLISQFTLFASTEKGNRPSYINAAGPDVAVPLYEAMRDKLQDELGKKIETGVFGADMKVSLVNNGPITITIDSKNRD
ncbi:MAG: D-tyrosyl-tRNA(Tyr) deacylase [Flavobacteriales bacterium]|nr:D-tyrosyl-tRNA(Tyr) deacylase [Flavobacteriales bacterium]